MKFTRVEQTLNKEAKIRKSCPSRQSTAQIRPKINLQKGNPKTRGQSRKGRRHTDEQMINEGRYKTLISGTKYMNFNILIIICPKAKSD